MTRTIDTHTHVLADATIKLLQKEVPQLGLKLTPIDADNAELEVDDVRYRPFPRGGHDLARRFADMDAAEVDMHVLSVAPQTWAPPSAPPSQRSKTMRSHGLLANIPIALPGSPPCRCTRRKKPPTNCAAP